MRLWFHVWWGSLLGRGGEGTVLRARDNLGRVVAFKISNAQSFLERRRSLMLEFERHQRAAGDGVVQVIGYNFDYDPPFIAYELAVKGSLADEMDRRRRAHHVYHPHDALRRIRSVLSALACVHARGIVHRDVKPSNLVLIRGELKLIDFGLGRTLERPAEFQTVAFVGTAAYAAPEQIGRFVYDHRADLYAVGVILYEMLMGRRPRRPRWAMQMPQTRWPNVTNRLNNLVWMLLADSPSQRPGNAAIALRLVDDALREYEALAAAARERARFEELRRLRMAAAAAEQRRRVAEQWAALVQRLLAQPSRSFRA